MFIAASAKAAISMRVSSMPYSVAAASVVQNRLETCSQSQFPFLSFRDANVPVIVCESVDSLDKTLDACRHLKATHSSGPTLSIDCEWKVPLYPHRFQRKVSLLQIYNGQTIGLLRLNLLTHGFTKPVPERIATVLKDVKVAKVGVNVVGDVKKLVRDFNLHTENHVDLMPLAHATLPETFPKRRTSLAKMTELLLNKTLDKSPDVRLCDWERRVLRDAEIEYAANDVYAGFELYRVLMRGRRKE